MGRLPGAQPSDNEEQERRSGWEWSESRRWIGRGILREECVEEDLCCLLEGVGGAGARQMMQ